MEFDDDTPIAQSFKRKRKPTQKKKDKRAGLDDLPGPANDHVPAVAAEHSTVNAQPEISVSEFDYSVENHFKFVDAVVKLCGYPDALEANQAETKRISDSITFLRQWRDFNYKPRVVKFACQRNSKEKDVVGGIKLSQFSAASVPKLKANQDEIGIGAESSKDFVMNVGGAVWALDWCPRIDRDAGSCVKSEFVAIAAHPPDSLYHKMGAPLTGRGAIQIWCVLTYMKDGPSQVIKGKKRPKIQGKGTVISNELNKVPRPRGRPRKKSLSDYVEKIDPDYDHTLTKMPVPRPRGRPRKKPLSDSVETIDPGNVNAQPLAIEYPMGSPECSSSDWPSGNGSNHVYGKDCVRIDEDSSRTGHTNTLLLTAPRGRVNKPKAGKEDQIQKNGLHFLRQCEHGEAAPVDPLKSALINFDSPSPDENITCTSSSVADTSENSIPVDVALPRMMFCLAHNGKVAWDVKWRPVDVYHPKSDYIMGHLAVLLGNGALEVWEVPLPHTVELVYPAFQECIDPRFIKLQPVFRCSMLKCGDRRSIPLTVEWSVSSPHDMILAGCHDGVVALWKFPVSDSLTETRPLLSFSADSGPIRSLSWAPNQSDLESANIIVTAGHKGFKFWDIRDPFRPLWDHPASLVTNALVWLPDPRCIYGSTEDGTMWLLSLEKAAHDLPVSKKCHQMASKHGFHQMDCSTFSLWSLQASRLTGMVAYCGEEGSTHCFQSTSRSLKDPSRNRVHHYLCGSLLEEGNALIVASPLPNSSFQARYPSMKRSGAEKRAKEGIGGSEDVGKPNEGISRREKGEEFESFPPKIVAMHRVRWNVNKGREKWLCYGGAAGLLRCQELDSSCFQ
ncbi:hypothetical protein ACS0TY_015505 [Phlomoides rotata]